MFVWVNLRILGECLCNWQTVIVLIKDDDFFEHCFMLELSCFLFSKVEYS